MPDDVTRGKIQSYIRDAHSKLDFLLENAVDDKEMARYLQGAMRDVNVALTLGTSYALTSGKIKLDRRSRSTTVDGRAVHLTNLEFGLVAYLMENSSRAVPIPELYRVVWGRDYIGFSDTISVKTYVLRIRKKIGNGAIQNVRGIGYRM